MGSSTEEETQQQQQQKDEMARESILLNVVWKGSEQYRLRVSQCATVLSVKALIEELTQVDVGNQKLLGLTKGRLPGDEDTLTGLGVASGVKVRLMGTPEARRLKPRLDEARSSSSSSSNTGYFDKRDDAIVARGAVGEKEKDKWAIHDDGDESNSTGRGGGYGSFGKVHVLSTDSVEEMEKTAKAMEVRIINAPRPGRKLVVLDLDYTIMDCSTTGVPENAIEMARPGLHEFLAAVYPHYDIMVWSQTKWYFVESKITMLGMLTHPGYKIVTALDISSMVWADLLYDGREERKRVKPLQLIWNRFPDHYGPHNTVHIDDLKRNFAFNWQNGLEIKPFYKGEHADSFECHDCLHTDLETDDDDGDSGDFQGGDRVLYKMAKYLVKISGLDTLENLDHGEWEDYQGE
ncbi:hypothetical protein GGI11_005915 [Coemansia sp. RSA 2049]|nr:hypothetical protein GGI11_005915 [Coemansia sp. RSA 2049]